jgi:hypothetical protein
MTRDQFEKIAKQRVLLLDMPLVGREDEDARKSFAITDTANVPSVGQAIYRAFNTNLKISIKGIKSLTDAVTTKDGAKHGSPQQMFEVHKDLFEGFLKTLPPFMKRNDMRVNMTNVIKIIRGYDWNGIGWLAYEQRNKVVKVNTFDRSEGL